MGQFWTLKNIDRRERFEGGKLGEWLFESDHYDLLEKLMTPVQLPRDYDKWLNEGKRVAQRGLLFRLPDEILVMIFNELDAEDMSLFCFAISCKDLLTLAKQPILKAMNRVIPTWANCRLVCLGEYADVDDIPADWLTAEELMRIEAAFAAQSARNADGSNPMNKRELEFEDQSPMEGLLNLIGEPCKPEPRDALLSMEDQIFDSIMQEGSSPQSRRKQYWREMRMLRAFVDHPTRPAPEVLCNVSKGEYVRHAALPDVSSYHFPDRVSLAHALIVQVCWSPDPSCNFALPEEGYDRVSRGPWAGDRFCVTAENTMPGLAPGIGEWRDVSDDVAKFLCLFFE
ncbi:hypothetical protein GY45DRAFT_1317390 [Cubamyces sp. BRFM 1775]|nr:hypothetical protein GY45DRAFT_1317390 [Cubamyces sp. BRFM 1775]